MAPKGRQGCQRAGPHPAKFLVCERKPKESSASRKQVNNNKKNKNKNKNDDDDEATANVIQGIQGPS